MMAWLLLPFHPVAQCCNCKFTICSFSFAQTRDLFPFDNHKHSQVLQCSSFWAVICSHYCVGSSCCLRKYYFQLYQCGRLSLALYFPFLISLSLSTAFLFFIIYISSTCDFVVVQIKKWSLSQRDCWVITDDRCRIRESFQLTSGHWYSSKPVCYWHNHAQIGMLDDGCIVMRT
jgi:hypothetical protein